MYRQLSPVRDIVAGLVALGGGELTAAEQEWAVEHLLDCPFHRRHVLDLDYHRHAPRVQHRQLCLQSCDASDKDACRALGKQGRPAAGPPTWPRGVGATAWDVPPRTSAPLLGGWGWGC